MKLKAFILIFLFLIENLLNAQKVGLVFSGGGAPGIAHIGIIKALEENNIPIDYITGTSIGAVVGGLYSMGYSPDEMIHFFKSNSFKQWSEGDIFPSEIYFFNTFDKAPSIFSIKFSFDKKHPFNLKTSWIPVSFLSPQAQNFSLFSLTMQASAVAKNNFDSLFIPFRCVASDVYHKKSYTFQNGQLSDAIRSSMTFPFIFKPLEINGNLLYDGGIYNNFPVDVMQRDFNPGFIIGSVVAYNPPKAGKLDTYMQLQNMIISPTNYQVQSGNDLLLELNLKEFDTFDFSKVDELVKIGYDSTLNHIDKIKAVTKERMTVNDLNLKRASFKSKYKELNFNKVQFSGIDRNKTTYIQRYFRLSPNHLFGMNEFKNAYYKLVSDETITEVIPRADYNDSTESYDLNLEMEALDQLKISVGGNLSTSLNNLLFVCANYKNLRKYPISICLNAQTGKLYNGLQFTARLDFPTHSDIFIKLNSGIQQFYYFNSNKWFFENNFIPTITLEETFAGLNAGISLGMHTIFETGIGYCKTKDFYIQTQNQDNYRIAKDESDFKTAKVFGQIRENTLDNPYYATSGSSFAASVQLLNSNEEFISGSIQPSYSSQPSTFQFQFRANYQNYLKLTSRFTLGTYAEISYSDNKPYQNFMATILQSPTFEPTAISKSVFNINFHSNQFCAVGLKPILCFSDRFQLREEAYLYLPYQKIIETDQHLGIYKTGNLTPVFLSESNLVYNLGDFYASLFAYTASKDWLLGIQLGIPLHPNRFNDME